MPEIAAWKKLIEPAVFEDVPGRDASSALAISEVISAKRQADALERIALALWGDEKNTGIVWLLGDLANRAQR